MVNDEVRVVGYGTEDRHSSKLAARVAATMIFLHAGKNALHPCRHAFGCTIDAASSNVA